MNKFFTLMIENRQIVSANNYEVYIGNANFEFLKKRYPFITEELQRQDHLLVAVKQ